MKFEPIAPIARAEAIAAAKSGVTARVCIALIAVSLYDADRDWALEFVSPFLSHEEAQVRGVAATAIGHLARIHRSVAVLRAVPILRSLLVDPEMGGSAQDALDDIDMFVPLQR